jgi:hypothetical protein
MQENQLRLKMFNQGDRVARRSEAAFGKINRNRIVERENIAQ